MVGDKEMRTMLMSLRDDVYRKVLSGEKIYEHRKVFPDEPVKAYIYVSAPTKAICGIMYLSNRTSLLKWNESMRCDNSCRRRQTVLQSMMNRWSEDLLRRLQFLMTSLSSNSNLE